MLFTDLKIIPPILEALKSEGYKSPTPIQEEAIPPILDGKDLLGCAQTGTGKTAAFAIPILQMIDVEQKTGKLPRNIRSLILTPTRELAIQIKESFATYGKNLKVRCALVYGGVPQRPQTDSLRSGADVLVATPGRLLDLIGQGFINLHHIRIFVLDEADRMLDMGFINDVKKIITHLPQIRQTLMFSATMPDEIARLAGTILTEPVKVAVTPVASTVEIVDQFVYFTDRRNKLPLLIHLLKDDNIKSALVFSQTKHGANKIVEKLEAAGVNAQAIHGNKTQRARQQALNDFKSGLSRVLVATDIAARGIDIDELSHVINYDMPNVPENYVHRIGRTGRAGLGGTAISFIDETEYPYLLATQRLISKKIEVVEEHPYPPMLPFAMTKTADRQAVPFSGRGSGFGRMSSGGSSGGHRRGRR